MKTSYLIHVVSSANSSVPGTLLGLNEYLWDGLMNPFLSVIGTIPQPQTHSGLFSLTKPFIDPNVPTTTILFLPWISDIFFKQTIQACCSSSSPSPHTAVWFLLTEAAETMAQVVTNPSAPGLSTLPHIPADRDPWLSLPLLPWMYCVPWSSSST